MKSSALAEPVIIGRERELTELRKQLDLAIAGSGSTVFVSGEAGSGKTRLTNEFLNVARNERVTVLSGWCLSNAAVPYFPFLEAFDSYISSKGVGKSIISQQLEAKTWLMGSDVAQNVTPQAWKDQTYAAVTKELLLMSTRNPVILFIDDLHWADSASLALLHYIARNIGSERILILATFRSEEVSVDVEGRGHKLLETLRLMGREGLFEEMKLPNLSRVDVGRISESMLGGKSHDRLVDKLATESRGIPLFVVESVRMLYEQGGLVQENGEWRLRVETINIPAKVKEVILRRIESLKPGQRRVLDAASVVGEKFDPKLVAAVVSQDSLDVLESLNTIALCTLLVFCEGDFYRFDHAKSREMLYDQIPPLLKKEYHSRIAERTESHILNVKKIPYSDLAYHFAQGGNKEKSLKYALAAGKDALARYSNVEALNHFMYVLQNVPEEPEYDHERVLALEGLSEAYFANSLFKKAMDTFEELEGKTTGLIRLRALRRAMDSAFFQGEFSHLLELTKKAEPIASIDRLESARVLMNRARDVMFLGNHEAGRADFEAALKIFEEELSLPDVARTSLGLGGLYGELRQETGLARALRAVTIFDELGDSRGLMDACNRAGQSFGYRLLTKEASQMLERAIKIGERIGDFNRVAEAKASSAWFLEGSGDFAGALAISLSVLEQADKTGSDWTRGMVYSNLVRQYTRLGNAALAEQYFQKLLTLPRQALTFAFVQFNLSKAIYLATKQQWNEVDKFFEECLSMPELDAVPLIRKKVTTYYAWILGQQNRTEEAEMHIERAQRMAERIDSFFQKPNAHALLMVPREVELGKDFDMRLDVVNVSRIPCENIRVEGLVTSDFRVHSLSEQCSLKDGSIVMNNKQLDPFQVVPIKLTLQPSRSGVFKLEPRVLFVDDSGRIKKFEIAPINLTVKAAVPVSTLGAEAETEPSKPEFKSEAAKKAFDYLVNAFMEDYRRQRLPQERAGWRTLMDVARQGKISKHSVYGASGGLGQSIRELENSGLVEVRFFSGERGRGGKIVKIRVACEKGIAKSRI